MFILINSIAPILAGFCFFIAVIFLWQTVKSGGRARRQMYSFERQTLRQYSHRYGLVGFVFLLGAIACIGLYGVSALAMSQMPTPTPTPTITFTPTVPPSPTLTPTATATQTTSPAPGAMTATPTNPAFTPSLTPTETATPTVTPPPTAFINSPNGLYLREAPGGTEQVELLPHQSSLILLSGVVTVEELVWQEVLTPAGNQGWVAAAFLIYPGTPTPETP